MVWVQDFFVAWVTKGPFSGKNLAVPRRPTNMPSQHHACSSLSLSSLYRYSITFTTIDGSTSFRLFLLLSYLFSFSFVRFLVLVSFPDLLVSYRLRMVSNITVYLISHASCVLSPFRSFCGMHDSIFVVD